MPSINEDEEVEKLANSLKSAGLAVSWLDAENRAREILGYPSRGVKIKVSEPKPDQKAKVDKIIKEVNNELKKIKEEPKSEEQKIFSKLNDPSFNIAESDMRLNELINASDKEIFTNDKDTLDKEKEAEKVEEETDSVVMTNEEIQEKEFDETEDAEENKDVEFDDEESAEDSEANNDAQTAEEKEKPRLTEEEKNMSDLTKMFNFSGK